MILAAGLGTRLLPLTNSRPKVLVSLRGITMLEFWIERLNRCGFNGVLLNAYHLKELVDEAVSERVWPIPVRVLNEPVLLGTGGGIRAALDYFEDNLFAVINVDIISNVNLVSLFEQHKLSGAEVSLLLHDWPEFNNVAVDEEGSVLGFGREAQAIQMRGKRRTPLAFTGIHFINPSALAGMCPRSPRRYSQHLPGAYSAGQPSRGPFSRRTFSGAKWDLSRATGKLPGSLLNWSRLASGLFQPGENISIHPEAVVHPDCSLKGSVVAGRGSGFPKASSLEDVILWDDIRIEKGSSLKDCIVADGMSISGSHTGKIFAPGAEMKSSIDNFPGLVSLLKKPGPFQAPSKMCRVLPLFGDGSDRRFFRIFCGSFSLSV